MAKWSQDQPNTTSGVDTGENAYHHIMYVVVQVSCSADRVLLAVVDGIRAEIRERLRSSGLHASAVNTEHDTCTRATGINVITSGPASAKLPQRECQIGPFHPKEACAGTVAAFADAVPPELRLPEELISNPPVNVSNAPRECRLLTPEEVVITEQYDAGDCQMMAILRSAGAEEYDAADRPLSDQDTLVRQMWQDGDFEGAPINLQIVATRYHDNELFGALESILNALA